jgi:hypothetical protein
MAWGFLTDSLRMLMGGGRGRNLAFVVLFAPCPERRSDTTNSSQLDHTHKRRSQPAATNYEWVDERDQTVSCVLYILPGC